MGCPTPAPTCRRVSQVPDPSFLTRRPLTRRRVQWLRHPFARPLVAGFIRFGRLATLIFILTRPNRVRFRCGSRFCLARLRVADCSNSTRLRGYLDERIISRVSSSQLTRWTTLYLAPQSRNPKISDWTSTAPRAWGWPSNLNFWNFGFEMQDSSNFEISHFHGPVCLLRQVY